MPRQVFRRFVNGAVTPERCVEAYHLQRTRFERIAERKLRNRQLTVTTAISRSNGRDLRTPQHRTAGRSFVFSRTEQEWRQAQS